MPADVIDELLELGDRAGTLLRGSNTSQTDETPFDFDDHRWRRFLVAYARVEETLVELAEAWGDSGNTEDFSHFVEAQITGSPNSYARSSANWRQEAFNRFDALMEIGRDWGNAPLRNVDRVIPKPDCDMRITPKH